jgi:hypothetical protein
LQRFSEILENCGEIFCWTVTISIYSFRHRTNLGVQKETMTSTTMLKGGSTTTKKKFGQNLNRLFVDEDSEKNKKAPTSRSGHGGKNNGLQLLNPGKTSSSFLSNKNKNSSDSNAAAVAPDAWGRSNTGKEEIVATTATRRSSGERDEKKSAAQQPAAAATINSGVEGVAASTLEVRKAAQMNTETAGTAITTPSNTTVKSSTSNNSSSWDEYGGRGGLSTSSGSKKQQQLVDTTDYMGQRAREKAAERQQEEAARETRRRRAAALKLKELDAKKVVDVVAPTSTVVRSLYDPNASAQQPQSAPKQQHHANNSKKQPAVSPSAAAGEVTSDQHVIHLHSYEDRGERPAPTNRMLFDPKSGNMVAVKARTTTSNNKEVGSSTTNGSSSKGNNVNTSKRVNKNRIRRGRNVDVATAVKKENSVTECGKTQQQSQDKNNNARGIKARKKSRGSNQKKKTRSENDQEAVSSMNDNSANITLYSGFDPQSLESTGIQQQVQTEIYELVKAGEKFDLLANADDSPTLKPTAKAFAPSQAALAAALAARNNPLTDEDFGDKNDVEDDFENNELCSDELEEEEEDDEEIHDDDDDVMEGLGFDPSSDMDGLMQSPNTSKLHFNLDALNLNNPDAPRHIFAFGSSGTWGDTKAESQDWDGLFGTGNDNKSSSDQTSFLPLTGSIASPHTSTNWGGFGSLSAADHAKDG